MHDLLDLDRYPLHLPGSAERNAPADRCQDALETEGLFNLDGFLKQAACNDILADLAPRLATGAFTRRRSHNIHFRDTLEGLAAGHPAMA